MTSVGIKRRSMLPPQTLEKLASSPNSAIIKVSDEVHVALHPRYTGKYNSGIIDFFNRHLNKYLPSLNGILLGYGKILLKEPNGHLLNEEYHIHLDVYSDFWVFRPNKESKIKGVVQKKSPSHVAILVHGLFTIPCYRPMGASAEGWPGTWVELNQSVLLSILETDMSQDIPFMRGELLEEEQDEEEIEGVNDQVTLVKREDWDSKADEKRKKKKKKKDKQPPEETEEDNAITESHYKKMEQEPEEESTDERKKSKKKKKKKDKNKDADSENDLIQKAPKTIEDERGNHGINERMDGEEEDESEEEIRNKNGNNERMDDEDEDESEEEGKNKNNDSSNLVGGILAKTQSNIKERKRKLEDLSSPQHAKKMKMEKDLPPSPVKSIPTSQEKSVENGENGPKISPATGSGLPDGWFFEVKGQAKKPKKTWISPGGMRFKTLKEAKEHVANSQLGASDSPAPAKNLQTTSTPAPGVQLPLNLPSFILPPLPGNIKLPQEPLPPPVLSKSLNEESILNDSTSKKKKKKKKKSLE